MRNHVWMTLAVIAALLAGPMTVWAGGTPPIGPASVPGKEYSNDLDETAAGLIDMHQNIWWDGTGGAADTFDYTPALPPELQTTTWVDALAHHADYLYDEVSHADATTMVLSTTGLPDILYTAPVHHAPIHGLVPETGVWAAAPIINAASPPDDVDGLEVWGPGGPGGDDADKFSLTGDPAAGAGGRISVWDYSTGAAVPYITAASLAGAIGRTDLFEQIDLDAMMVFDVSGDLVFGSGDSIMFSIAPVDVFDGGEIWVWDFDAGAAVFLTHGGEIWDTAHSVVGHFGLPTGGEFENINALEAIPEPATMSLLAVSGLAVLRRRKRS